jgi:hypothetical protein
LLVEEGDAALRAGRFDEAGARYAEAARLPQPEAATRGLQARRYALEEPARREVARRLFGEGASGPELLRTLGGLDELRPAEGFASYLLARQAQLRGDWVDCLRSVRSARGRALPGPLFEVEALRIQAACAVRTGDLASAREALQVLARDPAAARRLEAERALRRLEPAAAASGG